MIGRREFLICDVFCREKFQGNQLAVFPDGAGLTDEEMQVLAREMHFSETTFVLADRPGPRGFPVRIFTPAREVPFAGHPTLGTAFVIRQEFLAGAADKVVLDLKVGSIPVDVVEQGSRFVMTQAAPEFGSIIEPARAAATLGLKEEDVDTRFPVQEVSTGLWFLIVPVKKLAAVQGIRVNLAEYHGLARALQAKAVLAFCPETVGPDCDFHVRVFCDYYDVPEDPATGSANGCFCAWLVKHRYSGRPEVSARCEQGIELQRPSLLYLEGSEREGRIQVRVGGRAVLVGRGTIE